LRPFRQNLSYFGIDADTLLVERPALAARVFAEISGHLASGALRPLPYLATPIGRAHEAFRAMQQSRHVGKLLVTIDDDVAARSAVAPADGVRLRGDATYVVSGGLGGFGLATAHWLADRGATHLALFGRRGDTTDEARQGLAALAERGVAVMPMALDVTDSAAVDAAFADVRATMPPIRGIVHAAAVIEDAPIILVERDLMHRVMGAKMQGAWNLHRASLADPIELFVLYSSSSAVVGNPGQAAYVAANLFLDALAQHRRAAGLPALAIGWGAIKGVGFLTRNAQVEEMLSSRAGMGATPYQIALDDLGRMIAVDATRVAVAQFNLLRLGQSLAGARTPRFERLVPRGSTSAWRPADRWRACSTRRARTSASTC
jgi:phthiocerol/phenolphthiocerol synthesis type-I polyketide synthase C